MDAVIGTAGWSIPAAEADQFASEGSALERYAGRFAGVEINSSFHRPHRQSTWARWADSVPPGFRFAIKMPKTITHERKLVDCADLLDRFLDESSPLAGKLAILLVQLPPKLAFDAAVARAFLTQLRSRTRAVVVCEPRHPSWFETEADGLLDALGVARAGADPAITAAAALPGGWRGLAYWRLHGAPIMYRSSYDGEQLERYAEGIRSALGEGRSAWCMFDNTASSAATGNALALMARL